MTFIYGQDKEYEMLRFQLNDVELSEKKRLKAYSQLVDHSLLNDTVKPDVFINSVIKRKDLLSDVLTRKMRLVYESKRFRHSKALVIGKEILASDCSIDDSLFVYTSATESYRRIGYYDKAIENIITAIDICERIGNFDMKAYSLSSLGTIYLKQKDYEKALDYFHKSYEIYNRLKEDTKKNSILNNIGLVYSRQGISDSALTYFFDVRKYLEGQMIDSLSIEEHEFFYGLVGGNIADVYMSQGKYREAIPLLLKDREKSIKKNEKENNSITSSALGSVYLKLKKYVDAKMYLDEAFFIASKYNYRNTKCDVLKNYGHYYKAIKKFDTSISYMEKYQLLNDSLQADLVKNRTIQLQSLYELKDLEKELKLAEIANRENVLRLNTKQNQFLTSLSFSLFFLVLLAGLFINHRVKLKKNKELGIKNIEIQEKREELKKTLLEKEVLLKEVHHRVKNNLQMISSLLRLQANEMGDKNVKRVIEESINRISSMSLIHQKIYLKENFKSIELKPYFESLISEVSKSFSIHNKEIKLKTDISEINLSINNAVPIGLIVNELVSNSFKYAFEGKTNGEIYVKIGKTDSIVKIIVRDNGVGLPNTYDQKSEVSFGITLINLLVEQMEGVIRTYNNNGASFEISFIDSL